jgi:DNA-binding TFAR19-related protein (PDSD5 family)
LVGTSPLTSDDKTLDLLKRRKFIELSKKSVLKETKLNESSDKLENPKAVLQKILIDRGLEVLEAAESQYPEVTSQVEKLMAELILSGKIKESITGEQLYWFFNRLGINLRLNTKISFLEHGELKTLGEKLRGS